MPAEDKTDGQLEEKKDFAEEAATTVAAATSLASSDLQSAITLLMALEKKCRVGNDLTSLKKVTVHAVSVCGDVGNYPELSKQLVFINKRRSQKNAAVQDCVKKVSSASPHLT